MAEIRLKAEKRAATGKGAARRSRMAGNLPAVIYGRGSDPVAIEVNRRDLAVALNSDSGLNTLLDIEVDGTTTLALTRELQRDPVRGTPLHADFVKIDRKEAVEVEVPVHMTGESPGAKEGGVLEHLLFMAHVKALPTEVPEEIEADVSSLGIGDTLRVADLAGDRRFEILNDPDEVVVNVAAPITEEELEALEEGAGITTEVPEIGEETEAAEGEGPSDAEGGREPQGGTTEDESRG
ncbi:50S ribosomal protein L25/general stress protein Ctc [soil metagenome]